MSLPSIRPHAEYAKTEAGQLLRIADLLETLVVMIQTPPTISYLPHGTEDGWVPLDTGTSRKIQKMEKVEFIPPGSHVLVTPPEFE